MKIYTAFDPFVKLLRYKLSFKWWSLYCCYSSNWESLILLQSVLALFSPQKCILAMLSICFFLQLLLLSLLFPIFIGLFGIPWQCSFHCGVSVMCSYCGNSWWTCKLIAALIFINVSLKYKKNVDLSMMSMYFFLK